MEENDKSLCLARALNKCLKANVNVKDKTKNKPNLKEASSPASTINSHKCTICTQRFPSLNECLKHELLVHENSVKAKPQKTMRNKLQAILKSFNQDEKQSLRQEIRTALANCRHGEELAAILKVQRMNTENMELIYARIHKCLYEDLKQIRGLQIHPFGSIASGLALRDSDIDIYMEHDYTDDNLQHSPSHPKRGVANNDPQNPKQRNFVTSANRLTFNRISKLLYRSKCFEEICPIRQARVPIIKCKHTPTGFSLDINISCPSSVYNTKFLRDLVQRDGRIHELMLFVKIWAKQLQLVGRANMTSYCLVMLVLFYLQREHALPSMRQLQQVAPEQIVNGVNYAYDLEGMPALDARLSTFDLVRAFFHFYREYDFESFIVAPYLAMAMPVKDFKAGSFAFEEYHKQLRDLANFEGAPAPGLQVDRCMCVQDPFCLNLNVAKSMTPPSFEYFRKCFKHADDICAEHCSRQSSVDLAELYEELLFGIVDKIAQDVQVEASGSASIIGQAPPAALTLVPSAGPLNHSIVLGKLERKIMEKYQQLQQQPPTSLNQQWAQHYVEAIQEVVTQVYCLDLQKVSPTHCDKNQRMEHEHLQYTWTVGGSVDMWTFRQYQRLSNITVMQYQLQQTARFQEQRRQNAAFAVQLNGILSLSIKPNYASMDLRLAPLNGSSTAARPGKKDHLRKFFASLKNCMQSFNLREKLEADAKRLQSDDESSASSKKSEQQQKPTTISPNGHSKSL